MTTAAPESNSHFRLRELHSLFFLEFDRCAHENAVKLLKQIAKESRGAQATSDVPTATVEGRLSFWRQMFERARKYHQIDRAMELMECMRLEDTKRT
jgi:hypothetical protein